MIFAVEKLRDCWNEIMVLANQHWNETQNYRHEEGFNPCFERYAQQEEWGSYFQFTARVDGKLVGYSGVYIVPSMHSQKMVVSEDTWYVTPEYRKGFNAIRFFRYMENFCKDRGAVSVTLTAPEHTRADVIHRFMGYKQVSKVMHKKL